MMYSERYEDKAMQNAYKNACECLFYGYDKDFWNDCGIDEAERKEVWRQARVEVGVSQRMKGEI